VTNVVNNVELLSADACRDLLQAGLVGRVAFWADGPHVVPVNFAVSGSDLVLRTSADSMLAGRAPGTQVALEIDHIDYEGHRGWSVVAVGPCTALEDPEVIDAICGDWEPRPWADGDREAYLVIAPETVTGRRVGRGWTHANEVPVRRHR
jgi:uncharacterized protein